MDTTSQLYDIAAELRAIASQGLTYAADHYQRAHYEKVMRLSARIIGLIEERPPDGILAAFLDNLDHVSPQAGADAVVTRQGRLLLIQRRDNRLWGLPGGLVDVGETLAQASCRELQEETGLRASSVVRLLAILDSRLWHSQTKAHLYHVIFEVAVPEDQTPHPGPEALDAAFFSPDQLPPLAPGHHLAVPLVFDLLHGKRPLPYFDPLDG